jgi:uncharacterized RDD family membrane protein YckC
MTAEAAASSGESPGDLEYVGFWLRVLAAIIDSVLICVIIFPILLAVYGPVYFQSDRLIQGPVDFLVSWVLPAVAVVLFWIARQATPGKMAVGARIVDARTGGKPSTAQLVVRYVGYYVSMIPLLIGMFWIAFDPRKQGWHDKMARTVVVRAKGGTTQPVRFG